MLNLTPQGLYCEAGDFYIDPSRAVPRAVITHAHSDHARRGSQEYFCAASSASLLRLRVPSAKTIHAREYRESFRLGRARVSFHPAGHILGSAQVRVEVGGQVWVVSGDYKRDQDPTCEAFETIPCDTFLTEATFGLPVYRWPEPSDVALEIAEWWWENRKQGRASVLYCYSLGKTQRILAELARIPALKREKAYLHPSAQPITDAYREAGVRMLETTSDVPKRLSGELLIAPSSSFEDEYREWLGSYETAFASGWMAIRGMHHRRGYDRGFVLSDHADWPGLIRTVQETGASRIYVMHASSDALEKYLRKTGLDAESVDLLRVSDDPRRKLRKEKTAAPASVTPRQLEFWPNVIT